MAKEKETKVNYAGVIATLKEKAARELGVLPEDIKELTVVITEDGVTFNLNKKEK